MPLVQKPTEEKKTVEVKAPDGTTVQAEEINPPAKLDGKTPEELAKEIINPESQMLEIDGYVFENLVKVTKYMFKDDLAVKSEHFWNKEKDNYIAKALKELINSKEKTLSKYITKRDEQKTVDYYKFLRAKGMSIEEACKISGYVL